MAATDQSSTSGFDVIVIGSGTRHEQGSFYGVETTPRRLLSDALNARTPVPGLFLAGQDVMMPGIAGALWGGILGAAAIDPRLYKQLR